MAAPKIPGTGKRGGPCADENCSHGECSGIRQIVGSQCAYCSQPIGYDTGFYLLAEGAAVHSRCHMKAVASGRLTPGCADRCPDRS